MNRLRKNDPDETADGELPSLRDLRILMAAVEAGSISKAASALGVSQPAISKTITHIEHAVKAQLMVRSSTGIKPTPHGEVLLARGRAAIDELRRGIDAVKALADQQSGELRLAGNQMGLTAIIPRLIGRLYEVHPGITYHVVPAYNFADQVRELEQRNVELVVARLTPSIESSGLEAIELLKDEFVVVAGLGHRWRGRERVALAELMDEPWTLPSRHSVSGRLAAQIFEAEGLGLPRRAMIASSMRLHHQLAAHSGYLGLFSRAAARSLSDVDILPVELHGEPQSIGILTARHWTLSPLARLFIDQAAAYLRDDPLAAAS